MFGLQLARGWQAPSLPWWELCLLQPSLCGSGVIDHFACEILAVLKLACVDTSKVQLIMLVISVLLLPMPVLLICISYAFILSSILRISSLDGRSKAFPTCAAHLSVVVLVYGTALSMYLKPSNIDSQEIDKFIALVYAGLTPCWILSFIVYGTEKWKWLWKNCWLGTLFVLFQSLVANNICKY